MKTIYTTAGDASEESRVKVLQSTLGQLRLNNIATLDAIITHFTRLIDLTSADETYIVTLAQNLAPCILRPRLENNLTMDERHSYRLVRDLFAHKEEIFGELKRQSSSSGRPRAISTDESNRRANMEARQRAIVDRSRAVSPGPSARHRRDRSTDGSGSTRFPINVSSPSSTTERRTMRQSLDVPDSVNAPHNTSTTVTTNGSNSDGTGSVSTRDSVGSTGNETTSSMEKRDSLSRNSGGRYSRITKDGLAETEKELESKEEAVPVAGVEERVGVTLEDKPMDD